MTGSAARAGGWAWMVWAARAALAAWAWTEWAAALVATPWAAGAAALAADAAVPAVVDRADLALDRAASADAAVPAGLAADAAVLAEEAATVPRGVVPAAGKAWLPSAMAAETR